jgi:hypothetical protein
MLLLKRLVVCTYILCMFPSQANLQSADLLVITVVRDVKLALEHAGPTHQHHPATPPPSLCQRMNAAVRNTKVRLAKGVLSEIAAPSTGMILSSDMDPE